MKKSILVLALILLGGVIACSQTKAPEKAVAAFKAKFPAAKDVEWGKESATEFEAEFELNGMDVSANFSADGEWLETETTITQSDLPAAVVATLDSQFGDGKVKKAETVEKTGESLVYEVKLEQDEIEVEVVLDAAGTVLKKEVKGEENEENEGEEQEAEEEHGEHEAGLSTPAAVAKAFETKFPSAGEVKWGKESDVEYEAEFELNDQEMSANFDANGTWLETEAKLAPKDLPAPVLATLKSQFGDSKIKKAESLEKAGEPVVYEIKLEQGENEVEVVLDANGKVISKEAKGKEAEESEENEQEESHEHGEEG